MDLSIKELIIETYIDLITGVKTQTIKSVKIHKKQT